MKSLEDYQKEKLQAEIEKIKEETDQIRKQAGINAEAQTLADRKARAEINKLENDISQAKKPIYRQLPFWTAVLSILIPVATVIVSFYVSGGQKLFDIKNEELNLQKEKLDDSVVAVRQLANALYKKFSLDSSRVSEDSAEVIRKYKADSIAVAEKFRNDSIEAYNKNRKAIGILQSSMAVQKDSLTKAVAEAYFTIGLKRIIHNPESGFYWLMGDTAFKFLDKNDIYFAEHLLIAKRMLDTSLNINTKQIICLLLFDCTDDTLWLNRISGLADELGVIYKHDGTIMKQQSILMSNIFWTHLEQNYYSTQKAGDIVVRIFADAIPKLLDIDQRLTMNIFPGMSAMYSSSINLKIKPPSFGSSYALFVSQAKDAIFKNINDVVDSTGEVSNINGYSSGRAAAICLTYIAPAAFIVIATQIIADESGRWNDGSKKYLVRIVKQLKNKALTGVPHTDAFGDWPMIVAKPSEYQRWLQSHQVISDLIVNLRGHIYDPGIGKKLRQGD